MARQINESFNNFSSPYLINEKNRLELGQACNNQYLTLREIDVLKCILFGYSAKKIGLSLGISFRTAETYIENLKLKLSCNRKSEIIERVVELGLMQWVNLNFK